MRRDGRTCKLLAVNITSMALELQNKKRRKKIRIHSKEQRSIDRLFFLLFAPCIKPNLGTLEKIRVSSLLKKKKNFNMQYKDVMN